ncbi:hypothetical protein [Deinococcus navajonensis]|uniref:Uncharacterized protein n=1 Tax=Deinococcus navajonensis TaxID=309884 RepID=A0ABV8XQ21_9DEIO
MKPAPPLPVRQNTPAAVGGRAAAAPGVDLELLTRKVYALMLEDLRLELARREGKVR